MGENKLNKVQIDERNLMYRCDDCQRLTAREIVKAEDGKTIIVFRCYNAGCGHTWEIKLDVPFHSKDFKYGVDWY